MSIPDDHALASLPCVLLNACVLDAGMAGGKDNAPSGSRNPPCPRTHLWRPLSRALTSGGSRWAAEDSHDMVERC
jgi:hypothetical protein